MILMKKTVAKAQVITNTKDEVIQTMTRAIDTTGEKSLKKTREMIKTDTADTIEMMETDMIRVEIATKKRRRRREEEDEKGTIQERGSLRI